MKKRLLKLLALTLALALVFTQLSVSMFVSADADTVPEMNNTHYLAKDLAITGGGSYTASFWTDLAYGAGTTDFTQYGYAEFDFYFAYSEDTTVSNLRFKFVNDSSISAGSGFYDTGEIATNQWIHFVVPVSSINCAYTSGNKTIFNALGITRDTTVNTYVAAGGSCVVANLCLTNDTPVSPAMKNTYETDVDLQTSLTYSGATIKTAFATGGTYNLNNYTALEADIYVDSEDESFTFNFFLKDSSNLTLRYPVSVETNKWVHIVAPTAEFTPHNNADKTAVVAVGIENSAAGKAFLVNTAFTYEVPEMKNTYTTAQEVNYKISYTGATASATQQTVSLTPIDLTAYDYLEFDVYIAGDDTDFMLFFYDADGNRKATAYAATPYQWNHYCITASEFVFYSGDATRVTAFMLDSMLAGNTYRVANMCLTNYGPEMKNTYNFKEAIPYKQINATYPSSSHATHISAGKTYDLTTYEFIEFDIYVEYSRTDITASNARFYFTDSNYASSNAGRGFKDFTVTNGEWVHCVMTASDFNTGYAMNGVKTAATGFMFELSYWDSAANTNIRPDKFTVTNMCFTKFSPEMNNKYKTIVDLETSLHYTGSGSTRVNLPATYNVDDYTALEFDIYAESATADTFGRNLYMLTETGTSNGNGILRYTVVVPTNQWVHMVIHTNELGHWSGADSNAFTIGLEGADSTVSNVYIYNTAFTINYLSSDAEEYEEGTAINVTAKGDANDVISIYKDGSATALYTYTVGTVGSDTAYNLLNLGAFTTGEYLVTLVKEGATEIFDSVEFTVVEKRTLQQFKSATYVLDNDTDGYAAGTVTVTTDDSNSATDAVLYWGDGDGKLDGYAALDMISLTGLTTEFVIADGVLIPEGATSLLVYAYDGDENQTTTDCTEIALPENAASGNYGEVITEFQSVSDTHIVPSGYWNPSYTRMITEIAALSPNSAGLFINGDVVNGGTAEELDVFQSLHSAVAGAPDVYIGVGNHEFYGGDAVYDDETMTASVELFKQYATTPDGKNVADQHYDFWLNGYHFVFLGNDQIDSGLLSASFTDETMTWLRETLAEDRSTGRPTFLFLHQPISGTVNGSDSIATITSESVTKLKAVLADFPEVIMFNGHSHYPLAQDSMYAADGTLPTIFNTSSTSQAKTFYNGVQTDGSGSEGYYVYVYADKVIVRGRDFATGEWLPSAQFCVELENGTGAETSTVTYDNAGIGTAIAAATVVRGTQLAVEALTAEGYVFGGWFTSADYSADSKVTDTAYIEGDTTLYAKWNAWGDANGDGKVDILDYIRMKKLAASEDYDIDDYVYADLNEDTMIDAEDLVIMKKYLLGVISSLDPAIQ